MALSGQSDRAHVCPLSDQCAQSRIAFDPKQALVLWRTGKDATYSAAWVCNIADVTRDEVYVDVHA